MITRQFVVSFFDGIRDRIHKTMASDITEANVGSQYLLLVF